MKGSKNYFALIDAECVSRLEKRDGQECIENKGRIVEIFERYNIPEEYRKFIIKLNINSFLGSCDAREYLSRYQIDFINTRKIIDGSNLVGFGDKKVALLFRFLLERINNAAAIAFYDSLEANGYIDPYLNVISEVFGRGLSQSRKVLGRARKIIGKQNIAAII
ncbi:MAG: hypothetical protein K2J20_01120 [Bacilli bacterium]|nr:hypothetical protein [Bacilli bacterium]